MPGLTLRNTVGWQDTVIWNPHGDEGKGYRRFICVEAVRWGNPVQLVPGEGWCAWRPLRPLWRPFWLRFTYVTSVLVNNY
eukprot:COSAG01_NODE_29906_length_627_cov_1.026515_1_plen_80_part_00